MRWIALVTIPALIAGLFVLDERQRDEQEVSSANVVIAMPISPHEDAFGSTWYCAAGAVGATGADHRIFVTNPGTDEVTAQITLFPSIPNDRGTSQPGEVREHDLTVSAMTTESLSLFTFLGEVEGELLNLPEAHVAALVEIDSPSAVVSHEVSNSSGAGVGPCASSAAGSWFVAAGTTTRDARMVLSILNPFPDRAVVDISFATDDGLRRPDAYVGLVIPGRSLVAVDTGIEVTRRAEVATTVQTRTGRVVVEKTQIFTGEDEIEGVGLSLASAEPRLQWYFPVGSGSPDDDSATYVIFNPTDQVAEVDLDVRLDDASTGGVEPFQLTVPAGQRVVVPVNLATGHPVSEFQTVDTSARVPAEAAHWVSIRSFNDTPVVVERVMTRSSTPGRGVSTTPGAPVAAGEQLLPLPSDGSDTAVTLGVLNPSSETIGRVTLFAVADGEERAIPEVDGVEIAPRRRLVVDLEELGVEAEAIRVEASVPVIVEASGAGDPVIRWSTMATPAAAFISEPELFSF
jgi:hypothetical protein